MKGDFSRNTFDTSNRYTRVLMQQGRVQVDADWNEQAAIFLHFLRTLAADLIGPFGGPGDSFKIHPCVNENGQIREENGDLTVCGPQSESDFYVFTGHYYVDGILCENDRPVRYSEQVDYPSLEPLADGRYLVYLDVWERHITANEDDSIREVALGGPDTATRAKLVWQVKAEPLTDERLREFPGLDGDGACPILHDNWRSIVDQWWQADDRGWLRAIAKISKEMDLEEPCIIDPGATYRGPENQLYRVEIHLGSGENDGPTFKWSQENGSVTFPVVEIEGSMVSLAHLGRDGRFTLQEGDWVELVDDDVVLHGRATRLCQVQEVNRIDNTVTLNEAPAIDYHKEKHPMLRRWDQQKSADDTNLPNEHGLPITAGWLKLEEGIQIQFAPEDQEIQSRYRTGDYWLIPARTATGDIEWPQMPDSTPDAPNPQAVPPHGTDHHYAPLAVMSADNGTLAIQDCRHIIQSIVAAAAGN